jgi:hypothetical protein
VVGFVPSYHRTFVRWVNSGTLTLRRGRRHAGLADAESRPFRNLIQPQLHSADCSARVVTNSAAVHPRRRPQTSTRMRRLIFLSETIQQSSAPSGLSDTPVIFLATRAYYSSRGASPCQEDFSPLKCFAPPPAGSDDPRGTRKSAARVTQDGC